MVEALDLVGARRAAAPLEGGAFGRARGRLAGSHAYRLARLGLALVVSLALFAPFLASDRPLYLEAVPRGDFERARRVLVPVTQALAALLARTEEEFRAARPAESTQDLAAARAGERVALAGRLATLAAPLAHEARAPLERFAESLDGAVREAARGSLDRSRADALVEEARALREALDPARVTLRPVRSFPLLAALSPLEAGAACACSAGLLAALLLRRLGPGRRWALALLAGGLTGILWSALAGQGRAFHTGTYKEQLTRDELEARRVVFAPVPYGFAEQHPEEGLRPPTWLAASALDERGAYVSGPRVPRPDPVTGFVPATRPVEVRAGEPALNSPWRHLLGTDTTGRDLLARVIHGSRVSLAVGCLAAALLMGIGVTLGALAGYFGGLLDVLLSRLIEVVVSFPLLFLVLVAVAFLGPSLWNVILVLGCVGWTGVARLARSEFQRQRALDYVAAARALGYSTPRILLRHVLPNTLAPLLVAGTFAVAAAILVESALSFLGYGVEVPIPSWGALTSETRDLSSWWLPLFPGLILLVTVLCVQLLGDALRDALDPRQARGTEGGR